MTYCVKIASKFEAASEKHARLSETIASDLPRATSNVGTLHAKMGPEERASAREAIRANKAIATHEAREQKQQTKTAHKYLRRIVKVNFNLSAAFNTKAAKNLEATTKAEVMKLKKELSDLEKQAQDIVLAKAKTPSIDEARCEHICKSAEDWHTRIVTYLAGVACVLK